MSNFARAHDRWLEPPDDDPICEDGCGETLHWIPEESGMWDCTNKFCPLKFQGTEKEMAEALVDALEEICTLKANLDRSRREVTRLVAQYSNSGLE